MDLRLARLFVLICGLAPLAGCGGGSGVHGDSPPGGVGVQARPEAEALAGLAGPAEIARTLSFTGEDRLLTGSQFLSAPLFSRLNSEGESGVFDPAWVPLESDSLTDAAFGIYAFNITVFSGEEQLEFGWSVAPEPGQCFIGLGHHAGNRWDWQLLPDSEPLPVDPLSEYLSGDGLLLVAIVLLGETPATLDWIRAGGNTGPVAAISADPESGVTPQLVTFDASASVDYGGEIVSYAWDLDEDQVFEKGPNTSPELEHTFFSAGTYDVGVLVTDDEGETDTAFTTVVINSPGNQPPQADVTADPQSGPAPLTVEFDGSLSSDPDGSITKFEWDWDGDGTYDEDTGTIATASHEFPDPGTIDVVLRVTDDNDVSDTDTISISVSGAGNQPPVAAFSASPRHGSALLNVSFDASASSDPDGSITKYEWDWDGDGTYDEDMGTNPLSSHGFADPGNYDVVLRVTDNHGASDTAVYRVTAAIDGAYDELEDNDDLANANAVPLYDFTDFSGSLGPGGYNGDDDDWYQLRLDQGLKYTIYMHGFLDVDADLDIKLFRENGETEVGSSTGTDDDEQISWFCDATGIYYLRCYVHASSGTSEYLLDISDEVVVPPVADFNALPTSGNRPLAVSFDASTSFDPDGEIVKYEWDFDGNGSWDLTKTDTSTDPPLAEATYWALGDFDVVLRVTDDDGATDTHTLQISVGGAADSETEPNNDEDIANTDADAAVANELPAFPFNGWYGVVGPKPIPDDFGDPDDWYFFTVDSGGEVYLYMELFDAVCDIDMTLYDDGLTSLETSANTDDDEDITFTLPAAGIYYLRVYAFTSAPASGGYRLQGTFTP